MFALIVPIRLFEYYPVYNIDNVRGADYIGLHEAIKPWTSADASSPILVMIFRSIRRFARNTSPQMCVQYNFAVSYEYNVSRGGDEIVNA